MPSHPTFLKNTADPDGEQHTRARRQYKNRLCERHQKGTSLFVCSQYVFAHENLIFAQLHFPEGTGTIQNNGRARSHLFILWLVRQLVLAGDPCNLPHAWSSDSPPTPSFAGMEAMQVGGEPRKEVTVFPTWTPIWRTQAVLAQV